jgi:BMFP domain-containing protein YqiC
MEKIMRSANLKDNLKDKLSNLKLLDDVAKVASGALHSFGDVRGQVKTLVKERLDSFMGDMDMVSRDEFNRVEAMAKKARERQVELEKRLAVLEKNTPKKNTPKKNTAQKTTVGKKATAAKGKTKK